MIHIDDTSYHCGIEARGTASHVTIGKYSSIAAGCVVDCGFSHSVDNISTYPFHRLFSEAPTNIHSKGDVVIQNDCYIGEGVLIMSGVKIGNGAVVAARAVVTKDVLPYSIVGGVPAKIIGWRFSKEQIEKLLLLSWWNWNSGKIKENVSLLMSGDIDKFLDLHYKP
jgi:acetyltransferase-like isoleucine patch superfamily enzyme